MAGFFDNFREKVISAISPQEQGGSGALQTKGSVDNLISLGVLLWVVAQADNKFPVRNYFVSAPA